MFDVTPIFSSTVRVTWASDETQRTERASAMGATQSASCCAGRRRPPRKVDTRRRSAMPKVSIALMGNSLLYYNDVPRLLEAFGGSDLFDQGVVEQDSCLRGGVDLRELLARGNGMDEKFGEEDPGAPDVASLLSRHWDYVVMNDYTQAPANPNPNPGPKPEPNPDHRDHVVMNHCTQAPARAASRRASIDVLVHQIAPMLRRCGGTPILLETWAYLFPSKGSDDLGDHAEFSARLQQGYREYAAALARALPKEMAPRIAKVGTAFVAVLTLSLTLPYTDRTLTLTKVGTAFLAVREQRKALWPELYHSDGMHPSPIGSYLEVRPLALTLPLTPSPDPTPYPKPMSKPKPNP